MGTESFEVVEAATDEIAKATLKDHFEQIAKLAATGKVLGYTVCVLYQEDQEDEEGNDTSAACFIGGPMRTYAMLELTAAYNRI